MVLNADRIRDCLPYKRWRLSDCIAIAIKEFIAAYWLCNFRSLRGFSTASKFALSGAPFFDASTATVCWASPHRRSNRYWPRSVRSKSR